MRWTWRLACQTQRPLTAEVQAKVVEQVMDVLSALQLEMRTP